MKTATLAMLILGILTGTAGCSLFRWNHKPDSPPQTRRINPQAPHPLRGRIIEDRPQNAPYIKRIKFRVKIKPYMYTYQVAWSARTDQFVLTSVSPKANPPHIRRTSPPQTWRVKPLERAHKVRLAITLPGSAVGQASSQARLTANGGQAGKPSKPAPGKILNQSGGVVRAKVRKEKETIHFSFGSAAISRSEQMKLRRVAARIKKHHGDKVSVAGYACLPAVGTQAGWIGPKKVNEKLALGRAMAVVHELGKEGVKVGSVSSRARCCYIDLKNPSPNRRVEISWEASLPGWQTGLPGRQTGR